MSGPTNPRGIPRYAPAITGAIGPVRQSLLQQAQQWLGELALNAGQKLDMLNTGIGLAVRGPDSTAPDISRHMPAGEMTGLTTGGSGLVDSAQGLPLVRAEHGLMSLQADPRVIDAAGLALPAAGFAARAGLDTAKAIPGAVRMAGREFLEAGAGGTRLYTGPKSATWNAGKAQAFEDFEQAGGTRDGLWQAFGTGRLKDGSLIQEIDDSKAALKTDFASNKPLSEVIDHPDFEAAYPQLANDVRVSMEIDPQISGRGHGAYDSDKKLLTVVAKDATEARRLMLHEMQHSISRHEGRATGGSPDKAGRIVQAALDDPTTSPELRAKLKQIAYDDFESYQRLQDEVVARGAESRRDLPQDTRADTPPQWDRDPADWIVSRDGEPGISMAADGSSNLPKVRTKAALNIGLKIGDTGQLDPEEALQAIRALGINVTEHGVMQSGTEPTLVLGLDRALAADEAERLSVALRQEAIAQKVGKKGELFGPAKDKWGPFNDDYFLQLNKLRDAARRGEADPPIFDYSLLEKDPGHRIDVPLYDPPRGTPEREARLLRNKGAFTRLVEFARKGMTNDGLGWYNTEELRGEFIKEWGAEKGQQQYEKFIDLVGATSAGAKTDANLKIASRYYVEDAQGLAPTMPQKGSGYGHKAQNLHFQNAKDILEGKQLDPFEHPKRSRFSANLKGDWRHSTIDKHNVRALAIASRDKEWVATKLEDTKGAGKPAFWNEKKYGAWDPATFNPREFVERTRMPFDKIPVTWFESAPKGTAYKGLSQLNERLAAELGVTPAQAQAALWLGAGDSTGLGSKPIALMKVLDQRLSITARKRQITKREALRQMISGENPLLGVAGAASLLPLLGDEGDGA